MVKNTKDAKARLPLNVITNFMSLSLVTMIGLWVTPYLIKNFGVAVYGILPLLLSLLKYFNLLSGALTTAVGRFLTLSIQKNDYKSANEYYCSAICGVGLIGGLLLIVTVSILPWLENIITIPQGYETQTKGLLVLIVISVVLHVLGTVFNVGFFANHRFDLQNTVKIVANICRVLCIGFGLAYVSKTLYIVGGSYLLLSMILLIGGYVFLKKMVPELKLKRSSFSSLALKQMTAMGGWTLLNSFGVLLYYNIDFIIINRVLGAEAGGLYAPIVQLTLLIALIVATLNQIFAPIIIQSVAENNHAKMQQQTYRAIRYIGLVIILPIILICGFAKSVLVLWLGADFADLYKLLWLLMTPLVVLNSIRPLFALINGLNAVKYLGIATLLGGVLNLGLSLVLVKFTSLGIYAVALATILSLFIRNIIFLPLFSMKLIDGKVHKIYRQLISLLFASLFLQNLHHVVWIL